MVALAATAMVLGGCAPTDDKSPAPSGSPSPAESAVPQLPAGGSLESVAWNDQESGIPTLTFDQAVALDTPNARVISEGEGEPLAEGEVVVFNFVLYDGKTGELVYESYTPNTPDAFVLSRDTVDASLFQVISSVGMGGKILFSIDQEGQSALWGMEVVDRTTILDRAQGDAVTPAEGLPVITLGSDGEPAVSIGNITKPSELVSEVLIKGEGRAVAEGDYVWFHYSGWLWDGTPFDSSWPKPAPFESELSKGRLIDGWIDGIAGHTVGSQVLLIVPPELGYGDREQGVITPGSTLVFVVDILAAI